MNRRLRRSLFVSLLLAGLGELAGVAGQACLAQPSQRVDSALAGWPLSEFALTDQQGRAWTNERLDGHWTFVLIGDTNCGNPCAFALDALAGVYRRLAGTAKLPQVLFVSIVPERDTPAALAAYLQRFDRRFIGATGSPQALSVMLDELSQQGAAADAPAARHTGSLFLVGPDGALRGEYLPPFDAPALTAAYLKMRLRG